MSLDTHKQSAFIVFRLPVAPLKCLSTARLDRMNPGSLTVSHLPQPRQRGLCDEQKL